MAFSPFEERIDLSELVSEMEVQITNIADLVEAVRVGQSCLLLMRGGPGKEVRRALKIPSIVDASHLVHLREKILHPLRHKTPSPR